MDARAHELRCGDTKRRQGNKRTWIGAIWVTWKLAAKQCRVWGFTITLGYSRRMWAQAALDQKLGTLLRMHEAAFRVNVPWGTHSRRLSTLARVVGGNSDS